MARKTILLIDGDDGFAREVAAGMEPRGLRVVSTTSSADGLDLARAARPDLIVVNVELTPTNGWSVCTKLKKDDELKSIPVVLTSSTSTPDTFEKHRKLRTRADEYLLKPYSAADLLRLAAPLVGMEPEPEEDLVLEDESLSLGDFEAPSEDAGFSVADDEPLQGGAAGLLDEPPLGSGMEISLSPIEESLTRLDDDPLGAAPLEQDLPSGGLEELGDASGLLLDSGGGLLEGSLLDAEPFAEEPLAEEELGAEELGAEELGAALGAGLDEEPLDQSDLDSLGLGDDPLEVPSEAELEAQQDEAPELYEDFPADGYGHSAGGAPPATFGSVAVANDELAVFDQAFAQFAGGEEALLEGAADSAADPFLLPGQAFPTEAEAEPPPATPAPESWDAAGAFPEAGAGAEDFQSLGTSDPLAEFAASAGAFDDPFGAPAEDRAPEETAPALDATAAGDGAGASGPGEVTLGLEAMFGGAAPAAEDPPAEESPEPAPEDDSIAESELLAGGAASPFSVPGAPAPRPTSLSFADATALGELEARIASLEAELEGYHQTESTHDAELERLSDELRRRDRELLDLRNQLLEKDRAIHELRESEARLNVEVARARDERIRRDATVKALSARAEQMAGQARRLEVELSASREEVTAVTSLRERIGELEQLVAQSRSELEEARSTAERAVSTLELMQDRLSQAEERAGAAEHRASVLEESLGRARETLRGALAGIEPR